MKRWKKSKGIRTFLFCVLLAGVFLDVLAGMYMCIGRKYAGNRGREQDDFYVSRAGTSQILDGYIRLFEEYMQIGNLITKDGDIDYDKEIMVSLTDDKAYTIKELLRGSMSEGVGSEMLRKFMEEFSENCRNGISYPWKSRHMLTCDTRVIIEGDRIFSFASPNAKTRSPKQVAVMKKYLKNMQATVTDDVTYEDEFRDDISITFSGKISWKYQFDAKSSYEEYLITYYPSYARCYFLDRVITSYEKQGQTLFQEVYQSYRKDSSEEMLSEEEFNRYLEEDCKKRKKRIPQNEIPWSVHSVPRTMGEAKKYVTFLVETYQELKYLFSRCNFIYAYENSNNLVMTNHPADWQKIKGVLESGRSLEKATDRSDVAFVYFNSKNYEGVGNYPKETLPMSGNITEKIRTIGKNYSLASYQIAVGIDLRDVMHARREDEFVLTYREATQKRELFRFGNMLAVAGTVLTVLSFLLLLIRSGSPVIEGQEREELFWFERIWLEPQLLLAYLMIGMIAWVLKMWNGFLIHPVILLCALSVSLLAFGCLCILLSLVKRGKLGCGGQYSLILLIAREVVWRRTSLKAFVENFSYHMAFIPARRKFGFLMLAEAGLLLYYGISTIYVFLDQEISVSSYMTSSLGVIGLMLGVIFLGVLAVWQRNAMHDQMAEYEIIAAMKRIIGGDFSYQLPERNTMSLRVRELVRAVNQMGDVVGAAVEESVRSERMKTELIANVSHDIKTPLTSIINYVDLLQGEDIRDDRVRKYIGVLNQKSQRLKALMEDLIEASKASSGVMELEIHPMDFSELVRQTNGEFQERFDQSHLELIAEIPGEPMMFLGDGRRVFRILENLYSNAAKYAMEHTRIYVSLERVEENLVFTMKNVSAMKLNITPEELTERFVRGDHARSTEGSGLGLSIAKSLTELMGGRFWIELDGDLFSGRIAFPEEKI